MTTIPQVAEAMQTVLTTVAEQATRQSGAVQRQGKFSGATLVQTLVLGWLAAPDASLDQLCQTAVRLGVAVTPQALDQRFTPALAAALRQVLEAALGQVVTTDPVLAAVLERFTGVYVLDSTTITLPDALAEVWRGCGGSTEDGTAAALKLQVCLDVQRGGLTGSLHDGRASDHAAPELRMAAPVGAVRLQDLGYFAVAQLAEWMAAGVQFVSRLKVGTAVGTADGQRWELGRLLASQRQATVDLPVAIGAQQRLTCRLIAVRVPAAVAAERRRKLHEEAARRGKPASVARLELADWTVLVTSLAAEQLTVAEALVLARVRWQIELLFKLWKDGGKVDEWRTQKPWRILCEVYAKLTGMVVQHWLLLLGSWTAANRSLRKAALALRQDIGLVVWALTEPQRLPAILSRIGRWLAAAGRITRRRRRPATFQLLLDPTLQPLLDHGELDLVLDSPVAALA